MSDIRDAAQQQFGANAGAYRVSPVHAQGVDLVKLGELARQQRPRRVLDLGCGAGHASVAVAPHAGEVIAFDLTPAMLRQVEILARDRGLTNVATRQGDVQHLPFGDAEFDMLVTRYSAHHWHDPAAAVTAGFRVLVPGGILLLSDIMAPADPLLDTHLQTVELLRDRSHVRDWRVSEWEAMLARAGFESELLLRWDVHLEFTSWITRLATPAKRVDAIRATLDEAPDEVKRFFRVERDHSFNIPGVLLRAIKPGS
jgi:SAM-dependent methyltransferase